MPPPPHWVAPPAFTPGETARLERQASHLPSATVGACDVEDPPSVYALDTLQAVAIRPCHLAAYQGSSVVAVLPRAGGPAAPVILALPGLPGGATDGPEMVEPEFEPASGTLSSSYKSRGLADCGTFESWVRSDGAFRLAALNYQGRCGGAEPGEWPALYCTR